MRRDKAEMERKPVHATKLLIGQEDFLSDLDRLISEIDVLTGLSHDDSAFERWKRAVSAHLIHGFGENTTQIQDFDGICYYNVYAAFNSGLGDGWDDEPSYDPRSDYLAGLKHAKDHLLAIGDEVRRYKMGINVSACADGGAKNKVVSKDVFIVHGHDKELLTEVENAVRILGLNPIILSKQPNEGQTLIQKFEKNSQNVCFAIFLLTADETASVHSTSKTEEHARQNVVFEMGYFFHAFRRADGSHKGVFAILEEGVAKPGDIDGLVYQPYQKGRHGDWKLSLPKELRAAGVPFDPARALDL